MRKILFALIGCFVAICAHAAQVVNVDYVHKLITQKWDISVPIKTNNIMAVANMKYLLTAVDVANEILNGEKTTDYGNGEFATLQVADTVATIQAVETLVQKEDKSPKIFLTTTSTNSFSFKISAAGKFYVDWGDGKTETITKANTTNTTYSHTYSTSKSYTISIGGQATAYNTGTSTAAISFYSSASKIASIDGSLGAIFGTLSSDTNNQPRFYQTFYNATNMTGSIPSDLFAGISGAPASHMFYGTFSGCSGLTSIPENLFAGISGAPASYMFFRTFYNCTSLTGPSARINGQYLYEIWPSATSTQVGDMYYNATGLSDYLYIPFAWGGLGATTNEYPSAPSDAVYDFYLTTTSGTDMFAMQISAAGEFYIDWGDGKSEWITKLDTTNMTFGHKYASKGGYNIRLGGQATAYNTSTSTAAISFYLNFSDTQSKKIASIDGSLGAIFGTLSSDTNNQPRFYYTFYNATNIKGSIPSDLFAGISGAPASYMFYRTFEGCSGLTGAIPDGLFGNLSGAPATNMFNSTFYGCSKLTSIPSDLFAGISGAPASNMFYRTFYGCSKLTSIPSDLFAGISGAPAKDMFSSTFERCSGLTSIPENLFAGISGAPASSMFAYTFRGCSGLTSIPENLFAGISGAPASYMFRETFYGCSGLTGAIPDGLFGNLTGTPASYMFYQTFYGCSKLTSIPENLFGNISGTAQNSMFSETFYNCTSLTGPSARINGQYLYEIWPSATSTQVGDMYYNATGLSDYSTMPTVWK